MKAKISAFLHEEKQKKRNFPAKNNWKAWLLAARVRTLPVALSPIIVSSALAFQEKGLFRFFLAFFALCALVCIQVGTNLVNDALDFKKGADREGRIGPTRVTQAGLLSYESVLFGGFVCFAAACIFSLPLLISGGWMIGAILFISIACGYFYTGGPYPLSYLGISDVFILLFYGWVSTFTLFYLQTGGFSFSCLVAGAQIGLLAIVPHAINNLRDKESDLLAGKRTAAVRFGSRFAKGEIVLCSLIPFVLGIYWMEKGWTLAALLPFLTLGFVVHNLYGIVKSKVSGPIYNLFLARSALFQLFFGLLLALGVAIGS